MSLTLFKTTSRTGAAPGAVVDIQRELPTTSLLVPANPAILDPGSPPVHRGGILLNPLSGSSRSRSKSTASSSRSQSVGVYSGGSAITRTQTGASIASVASTASSIAQDSSSHGSYEDVSSSDGASSLGSSYKDAKLTFAPLPSSGRQRSSSMTLGVSARAAMLAGQPQTTAQMQMQASNSSSSNSGSPGWQSQLPQVQKAQAAAAAGQPIPWHAGGPLPEKYEHAYFANTACVDTLHDSVKTVKDIKPGLKKAWNMLKRRSSSASSDKSDDSNPGRSATSTVEPSQNGSALSRLDSRASEISIDEAIPEEDERDNAVDMTTEEPQGQPLARGRPMQRHSSLRAATCASIGLGVPAEGDAEDMEDHPMTGEKTPRRRASPPASLLTVSLLRPLQVADSAGSQRHVKYDAQPSPYPHHMRPSDSGSGGNTPRRSMSMTESSILADGKMSNAHHQAIYGFDEQVLSHKFADLELKRQQWESAHAHHTASVEATSPGSATPIAASPNSHSHAVHSIKMHYIDTNLNASTSDEESDMSPASVSVTDSEDEVPVPDSKQIAGARSELVEGHRHR